jgi:predicted O-linked N-acetylglucosamine transferase (SPINDLY family)
MAGPLTLPEAVAQAFLAYSDGDLDRADALCRAILTAKPDDFDALHLGAAILSRRGRHAEALHGYDRALAIRPDVAPAWNNRGNCLKELQRYDEALASYDKALALKSDDPMALNNRGVLLQTMFRLEEALASFDRALARRPNFADALNNRGNTLQKLMRLDDALVSYDRAIALDPRHVEAYYNRGNALRQLKRFDEAIASYDRALARKPDHASAFNWLAHCVNWTCNWPRKAALASEVVARVAERRSVISPFTFLGFSDDPALQRTCAETFTADAFPELPAPLVTGPTRAHGKLRIAYLSADFHEHATAYQLAGLFEQHDRAQFEITAISFGVDDGSPMRRRLSAAFDTFHDVRRQSDGAVAELMHAHSIDIAVSLNAFTQNTRPGILARRPAPVQVHWPGFAGPTGAPFIDYMIADETVVPQDHQTFFSEQIAYLPDCYLPTDSNRIVAEATPARRNAGLPDDAFVFCCFNNLWKITPELFDVWMRLLQAVHGSVLWLLQDNEIAARNLCSEAQARGIDPHRLVFAGRLGSAEHLARHRHADLFLDTLPCNAHATASDALWMGVPLVTLMGEGFASRVAASMLRAARLPELIATSLPDYETLALGLAQNADLLANCRECLTRDRLKLPLFDTARFCRNLESAYLQMAEINRRGEAPRSFAVNPRP